jgi:large subunit ribosomal protein L10
MKSRDDKEKEVESLHKELEGCENVFVTGFEQITVEQDFELRKAVREVGGKYRVIKNNLAERAGAGTSAEPILKKLAGMTSLAYTTSDPVALAKALTAYAKNYPTFTFKAGVVEGRVIDAGAIQTLAAMPSRDELFAKLLYVIQAPAQNVARAINGVGRNLAVVLDQACKENKFST